MSKVLVINNGELVQYRGVKKTFVIPTDVKRIADDAFRWSACDYIEMPIECPDFNMLMVKMLEIFQQSFAVRWHHYMMLVILK